MLRTDESGRRGLSVAMIADQVSNSNSLVPNGRLLYNDTMITAATDTMNPLTTSPLRNMATANPTTSKMLDTRTMRVSTIATFPVLNSRPMQNSRNKVARDRRTQTRGSACDFESFMA